MKQVGVYLWRGPRPKDIMNLVHDGFERIIVLQSGAENKFTDSLYEAQLRCKLSDDAYYSQIEVIYIPCSNIFPPHRVAIQYCINMLSENCKTYLHCHSGVDRTGVMVMAFRIVYQLWDFKKAHQEWVDEGRHWWFFWWKPFLKRRFK